MSKELTVTVIGLGKIGLPLACQLASSGIKVYGFDNSERVLKNIELELDDGLEPGLFEKLKSNLKTKDLELRRSLGDSIAASTHIIVAIPLYVDSAGVTNFFNLDQLTAQIGTQIRSGQTIIYETTLPIGTTRNRLLNILEKESGLVGGIDFYLAYSPERVSTGSFFRDMSYYPKLVGGLGARDAIEARVLYEAGIEFEDRPDLMETNGVWTLDSCEAAEFAKLAETTFRDVNIALANTFSSHADQLGIDFEAIRKACNSQPYSMIHQPGISVGGHCIPVYPRMYLETHPSAELVRTARSINEAMPAYAVRKLKSKLGTLEGKKVLISGLSYRTGVKEAAFSGAVSIYNECLIEGASVAIVDELFSSKEIESMGFISKGSTFDAMLINSGSRSFQLGQIERLRTGAQIVDGRRVLQPGDFPRLTYL